MAKKMWGTFSSKFFRSWNESRKEDGQKVNLRGLRVGFYPAKKAGNNSSIRYW